MFVEKKNKILQYASEVVFTNNQSAYFLNVTTSVKHIVKPDKQFMILEVINTGDVGEIYSKFLNGDKYFNIWARNILIDSSTNERDSDKCVFYKCEIINMMSIESHKDISSVRIVVKI